MAKLNDKVVYAFSFTTFYSFDNVALDADSEEIVQAALDKLLSQSQGINCTTVIIAHRLRTVRNADAIAVVNDGKIVELGSHDKLMRIPKGYYRSMVEKSSGGNLAVE
jgi:ATP-binding cassette subfamily B (MDR/TAP) protein 1